MASHMKKEAECPICLEMLKKPIRILSCGHNLCQCCLQELIASSRNSRCPICRKGINSTISVEAFQRNRIVENMIEQIDQIAVAPTVNVVQEVKLLTGDAMQQLKDLAYSYEQKGQLDEAINTWNTIVGHSQHINKILPFISMIICLLKMGELDKAVVSSVELVSLLESTADEIPSIKNKCDQGICNIIMLFFKFKNFSVIFQLLQCRFCLLKKLYTGKAMLDNMFNISVLITKVAQALNTVDEKMILIQQYEFLDDVLLFMQNSPATDLEIIKFKCDKVASFANNYGFCCTSVNDYLKAIMLFNQAIASRKLVFGNESNNYQNLANSYNNLGVSLEYFNQLPKAKAAYLTAIAIKKQARDFKNEEDRNESISYTTNSLQRVQNKLNGRFL